MHDASIRPGLSGSDGIQVAHSRSTSVNTPRNLTRSCTICCATGLRAEQLALLGPHRGDLRHGRGASRSLSPRYGHALHG